MPPPWPRCPPGPPHRLTEGLVVLGALSWATSFLLVGGHSESEVGKTVGDLMANPFQAGLFALLALQLRTRAAGLGRGTVAFMHVEFVLLALATVWSFVHGLAPSMRDDAWLAVLDVSWPLSMLGMAVLGVKVALTGRWRGPVRFWPAVAGELGAGLRAAVRRCSARVRSSTWPGPSTCSSATRRSGCCWSCART